MFSNQVLSYKVNTYNIVPIMELGETIEHGIQLHCWVNKKG